MFAKAAITHLHPPPRKPAHLLAEVVATTKLMLVIFALASARGLMVPQALGGALAGLAIRRLYPSGSRAAGAEIVLPDPS